MIRVGRREARRGLEQSSLGLEEGQSAEGVKATEGLTWGDGRRREEDGSGFRAITVGSTD